MTESHSEVIQSPTDRLSQADLARELKKSEAWCERKRWDGTGPAFIKIGRTPYYLRKDVQAWLEAQRRTSTRSNSEGALT